MKKLLTLLLIVPCLAFAQPKQKPGVVYDAVITRVIDGDTVGIAATWLPAPLKQELSIRVFGVDTPEKGHRAQCPSEAQRGEAATAFTKQAIANSQKLTKCRVIKGNEKVTQKGAKCFQKMPYKSTSYMLCRVIKVMIIVSKDIFIKYCICIQLYFMSHG